MSESFRIVRGFEDHARTQIARLFWAAFSDKLFGVLAPEDKALAFIADVLQPSHAFCALGADGSILGVAGFKTSKGGLVAGGYRDLRRYYGTFGALWRGVLLDLLDRPLKEGQLLMDGIFVASGARGIGLGSALIATILQEAEARGMTEVRLDVIDRNTRARALYERHGFVAGPEQQMGPLGWIFGFQSAVTMVRPLSETA